MSPKPDNVDALVRMLVRSIDKRIEHSMVPTEGDPSRRDVRFSMQKRTATVSLRVEDLDAAQQDLMRRNQVRTVLKRAIDGMMFRTAPIASTAMLRPDSHTEGFFRSQSRSQSSGRKRR